MAPPKEKRSKQKITKRARRQSPPINYEVLYEQETHRDWDLLSFEEQQEYVEAKIEEEEKRKTVRQKISHQSMSDPSQQASGSGTVPPPATPMTIEAMGHALQSLMQAMNVTVTTVNTLTTNVNVASSVRPRATKVAVSKPKAWNGKGGSMEARHFLAAFYNYAQNEGETLNDWDAATLTWDQNDNKWIAAVLNLMEDEARTWALPYLETLTNGRHPFNGLYRNFTDAFTKRFAPLDSTEAARDTLKALKQGKSSVAEYISKFDQFVQQRVGQTRITGRDSMTDSQKVSRTP